jgi:chromosome segregation ATPase
MKTRLSTRAVLVALLCGAAAAAPASERSRERNAQWLQLGGVLREAAGGAAQRDNPGRYGETVLGGAATGAAQGCAAAALEALLRRERGDALRRACKDGAAVQATAGAVDGHFTALQEEANQRQISTLRVATEQVQRENQQIQSLIEASGQSLRDGQARLSALRRDVAARKVSAAEAEQARAAEQRNAEAMRNALENLKAARRQHAASSLQATGSTAERRQLDGEIARMDKQITTLERQLADYQRALAVSGA